MSARAKAVAAPPAYEFLRLTVPAREALIRAGNTVEPSVAHGGGRPLYWDVALSGTVPTGLVLCLIGHGHDQHRGLRTEDEPTYPQEWPSQAIAWHERGDWVPCPKCGGALVWYEAGYVPGYRLCTSGHHVQLSSDGRSAKLAGRAL